MTDAPPITPAMWDRMPWHAKARAIHALDRRITALQEQEADLAARTAAAEARLTRELTLKKRQLDLAAALLADLGDVALERARAELHLAVAGPDPDAAEHRRVLDDAWGHTRCVDPGPHSPGPTRRGRCNRHYKAAAKARHETAAAAA